MLAALAVSWPLARHWVWSREVVANLDYIRALRRLEADPRGGFPQLSAQGLALKDLWSGRELKRVIYSRPVARLGAAPTAA